MPCLPSLLVGTWRSTHTRLVRWCHLDWEISQFLSQVGGTLYPPRTQDIPASLLLHIQPALQLKLSTWLWKIWIYICIIFSQAEIPFLPQLLAFRRLKAVFKSKGVFIAQLSWLNLSLESFIDFIEFLLYRLFALFSYYQIFQPSVQYWCYSVQIGLYLKCLRPQPQMMLSQLLDDCALLTNQEAEIGTVSPWTY